MKLKLHVNAHIQYMCTHTTVYFLQKRTMFVPEGKVFIYKQTYLLHG